MMTRSSTPWLVLGALALLVPASAEARCAPPGLEVSVATDPSNAIPLDGSFLVQLTPAYPGNRTLRDFPSSLAIEGARRIPLSLDVLAPGLARATPRRAPRAGSYRLVGQGVGGARLVRFSASATLPPPPTIPAVRRVSYLETPAQSRRGRTSYSLRVEFASAPSAAAFIALLDSAGQGSWSAAQPGSPALEAYTQGGRCQRPPTGLQPLRVGTRAEVLLIDAFGRVARSPRSSIVAR